MNSPKDVMKMMNDNDCKFVDLHSQILKVKNSMFPCLRQRLRSLSLKMAILLTGHHSWLERYSGLRYVVNTRSVYSGYGSV